MNSIKRFGVSIESNLIDRFDKYIKSKNYANRSEALRDLIRKELVGEEWLQLDKMLQVQLFWYMTTIKESLQIV